MPLAVQSFLRTSIAIACGARSTAGWGIDVKEQRIRDARKHDERHPLPNRMPLVVEPNLAKSYVPEPVVL